MTKRPTMADVARRANVSRTTVSFVLNNVPHVNIPDETRQRILEAARELNYYPSAIARSLIRQQTDMVALVYPRPADHLSADAFLPLVSWGITSAISVAGFKLLLETVEDITRPDAYADLVRDGRIDGMILCGPRSDDHQLRQVALDRPNFPIVLIGRLPESHFPFVDVNNVDAAREAVEHLIVLGHQRIACITSSAPEYTASADRLQGYCEALAAHNLPLDPALIRYGDHWKTGFEATNWLLALPEPPSAVFAASDVVALGALQAAKANGLHIPRDLALVGFDDIPIAEHLTPPLTTVRVPIRDIGSAAAGMLIEMIQTGARPAPVILETELIVRESCGAYFHPLNE